MGWVIPPAHAYLRFCVFQALCGSPVYPCTPFFGTTTKPLAPTPGVTGPRKVCVRVVDVFGFEAEVVATVDVAA